MIYKIRKTIASSQTIRLIVAILGGMMVMTIELPSPAVGLNYEEQIYVAPKINRNEFQRVSGPVRKEGVSGAEQCGSYVRRAKLVRETFQLKGINDSGAVVQVVTFPKDYMYAAHDSFGSLLQTAAYDEKLSGSGDLSARNSKGAVYSMGVCRQNHGRDHLLRPKG